MASETPEVIIEGEVSDVLEPQKELAKLEVELSKNETFQKFIALQKAVNEKMATIRKNVEAVMVPAYQAGKVDKSIKGDWGSVTVTESDRFEIDEALLQPKFFKKVVDESKIRATFQLEGKAPKGTKPYKKYGIMMKFKEAK